MNWNGISVAISLALIACPTSASELTKSEKELVERSQAIARWEGASIDPLGEDRAKGLAIYQGHLNDYISCVRGQIKSGKIQKAETLPTDENRACLFEFSLTMVSCGIYFGKYLINSGTGTTANNFCALSFAIEMTQISDSGK